MESDSVLGQIFACAYLLFFWLRIVVLVVSKRCRLHVLSRKSNIENLWFVSLSCLRTQVLVRVPNFFWIYFWKWDQRLRAGLDRAREVPIGFQVQRFNHWVIIAILTLISFWWNPIPSLDKFLLALIFFFFGWGLSCWSFPNAVAYMSFPGKVILRIFGSSVCCLRTQVLVRVPNFFWLYFWKWDQRLRAGLDRAREVPIGFQVQRFNHWVIIAILTLILFWWNPIPSLDKFSLALIFFFVAEDCRAGRFQTLSPTCPFQEK